MKFTDFLNYKIDEAAGSLAGIPKVLVRTITSNTHGGYGGENSKIELYKANAKQKDLTAAAKMTGGYVSPSDRSSSWSSRLSTAERQALETKKLYAGVLAKVNGEWAFYIAYEDYYTGNNKYRLYSAEGDVGIKTREKISGTGKYDSRIAKYIEPKYYEYTRRELSASDIGDVVDFNNNKVDVYLVTADMERLAKREQRQADREGIKNYVTPEKKNATIKFLNSRTNDLISSMKQDIQDSANSINIKVKSSIDSIMNGSEFKKIDIKDELDKLNTKISEFNTLNFYLMNMMQTGMFEKNWKNNTNKTYAYKKFMEIANKINNIGNE